MKKKLCFVLIGASAVLCGGHWDSPDKAARLRSQIPGQHFRDMDPAEFMKKESGKAMALWKGPLNDEAFRGLAEKRDSRYGIGTDREIFSLIPSSISPYARLRNVPFPEIRPWLHWTGHFTQDQHDSYNGLRTYCPFCFSNNIRILFDGKNPDRAETSCCKKALYRRNFPSGYDLKPNAAAKFRYLDDSVREIPCTLFADRKGRTWELFIGHLFNDRDWGLARRILRYRLAVPYLRTGDPFYAYKAAVFFDRMKDVYYGLPLSLQNLIAPGKSGIGLSRREWEELPRPNIWAEMPEIGWWNRGNPGFARGWINLAGEAGDAAVFALLRHHPAFKYYSKMKYGDPEKLEREVIRMYLREINLVFESVNLMGLTVSYQHADYTGILASALLARDKVLLDFAAANQELSIYNHHFADGLNGEGSTGYQGMLRRQFYPRMLDKDGYSLIDPAFKQENPFFVNTAVKASFRQVGARGIFFEHGDCYQFLKEEPGQPMGNLQKNGENRENETRPSEVWPSWGTGVLRVGTHGRRLETVLNFSRPSGHGGLMMGLAAWFDGIYGIRMHGYACPWGDAGKDGVAEINRLNMPRKAVHVPPARPDVHATWYRLLAQSAIGQNSVAVNEIGSLKRGLSELIMFKGGEAYGSPESKFQILEVNAIGEFKKMGIPDVEKYRRALLAVETPGGRGYALDFVTVRGGKSQTVWYSVWGDRIQESLPPAGKTYPDMVHALFNGVPPAPDKHINGRLYQGTFPVYEHVTGVEEHSVGGNAWFADFRTDYYAYSRDEHGNETGRPEPGFGIVNFRIAGIPSGSRSSLLRARAPWAGLTGRNQQTRSGGYLVNKTIVFEDAFEVLAQRRTALPGAVLESCFAMLLEGRHPGEKPVVACWESIPVAESGAKAVKLQLTEGGTDIIIYQQGNRKLSLPGGIETDARYAMLRYDRNGNLKRMDMAGGNFLRAGEKQIVDRAEDSGVIVDINADVTGDRTGSELCIKPDHPWDIGRAKGRELLIRLKRANGLENNEAYRIESAENLPDGRVLVKLAGPAPFIAGWHQAFRSADGKENKARTNRPIQKFNGIGWYPGTKVYFPRADRTFIVKDAGDGELEVADGADLWKSGILEGDWFMLYAVEPGLKVSVPRSAFGRF